MKGIPLTDGLKQLPLWQKRKAHSSMPHKQWHLGANIHQKANRASQLHATQGTYFLLIRIHHLREMSTKDCLFLNIMRFKAITFRRILNQCKTALLAYKSTIYIKFGVTYWGAVTKKNPKSLWLLLQLFDFPLLTVQWLQHSLIGIWASCDILRHRNNTHSIKKQSDT